jgi:hypothetical protein
VLEERELEIIRANASKSVAEISSTATAEQAQITADAELKNEEIRGETLVMKLREETIGTTEALKLANDAKNSSSLLISAKMLEVADQKAETLKVIGEGESEIAEVMASRRKFELLNSQCDLLSKMGGNKNLKIYGDNQDDVLA